RKYAGTKGSAQGITPIDKKSLTRLKRCASRPGIDMPSAIRARSARTSLGSSRVETFAARAAAGCAEGDDRNWSFSWRRSRNSSCRARDSPEPNGAGRLFPFRLPDGRRRLAGLLLGIVCSSDSYDALTNLR